MLVLCRWNLAIFLGTRTRAKSSILLICSNSVFLERKRNDGFCPILLRIPFVSVSLVTFRFNHVFYLCPVAGMQEWIRVPACCVLPTLLGWYTLRKDSPFISNVQRKGQNFSSSALNYNICRSHLTLLSLLMLNGSHPMSVSHQHVCPLPLNLLAVFLGKGALLYIVSVGHLALPIFIHLCRLPLYSCSI